MFILNSGNSVWMNLAVIVMMWIVLSFLLGMLWILLVEIKISINTWRQNQEDTKLFQEVEEIRNDFS